MNGFWKQQFSTAQRLLPLSGAAPGWEQAVAHIDGMIRVLEEDRDRLDPTAFRQRRQALISARGSAAIRSRDRCLDWLKDAAALF